MGGTTIVGKNTLLSCASVPCTALLSWVTTSNNCDPSGLLSTVAHACGPRASFTNPRANSSKLIFPLSSSSHRSWLTHKNAGSTMIMIEKSYDLIHSLNKIKNEYGLAGKRLKNVGHGTVARNQPP